MEFNSIYISTVDFRNDISEKLNIVGFGKKNIIITRREKPLAAIISIEEYEQFIALKEQEQNKWR